MIQKPKSKWRPVALDTVVSVLASVCFVGLTRKMQERDSVIYKYNMPLNKKKLCDLDIKRYLILMFF